MGSINWTDWGLWLVYLVFLSTVIFLIQNFSKTKYARFMLPGFLIKVFGGLLFVLIHVYYYGFGDTFLYFQGSSVVAETMASDFGVFLKLMISGGNELPPELSSYANSIQYSNASEEWFMIKLLSPMTFLCFHSFLTTTLLVSCLSFIGSWKLFQVLRDITPNYDKITFFIAFLIPSVLFWGGGIMKDSFSLCALNILIYLVYFSIFKRSFKPFYLLGAILCGLIIFWLKAYIILAFLPALIFGLNSILIKRMESKFLKYVIGTLVVAISLGVLIVLPSILSNYSEKYQLEQLQNRVKGFHSWHTDLGGSAYSLGEIEYTVTGVLSKVPAALNVTLFRPYLWESGSLVVFVASLESLGFLILSVLALFQLRFRIRKIITEHPIVVTFFTYILIFGFVVGFTSYNFGALGRYKIPIFSLFAFLVFYLSEKASAKWLVRFRN
jgi:hypothetical protein